MSLINEALKRAQQSSTRSSSPSAAEPPLQPAVPVATPRKQPFWLMPIGAVVLLLVGATLVTLARRPETPRQLNPAPVVSRSLAVASVRSPTAPAAPVQPQRA